MRLRDDRRAAALQVGAVLLLGFLVIGLALYQATVVPAQNERVEFDHSQAVQDRLQEVRNGILRTAAAERTSPTAVPLGTRYPTRIVAVNPPPSSGRLATEPGGAVTLVNATAVDNETADYWNGTDRRYTTRRLTYDPDYSRYQAAPVTAYDDTVLYNDFGGRTRAVTDQRLLTGNLIYVVALQGSLGRTGTAAATVSPAPVSASDRTVAVNNDSGMTLRVDTALSQAEWRDLLADQYERNGGRIEGNASGVTVDGGTLVVDLRPGTYRLRMAKVGVGTGVTDTTERYLTVVDGAEGVTAGGTRRVVLEVRDAYNNPVPGVSVDAAVDGQGSIRPSEAVSNGEGRVVYEYGAPDAVTGSRTDGLNFTFDGPVDGPSFSGGDAESVRINVTVAPRADDGESSSTTLYPDAYNDGTGGDDSIPPGDGAEGELTSFGEMQSDTSGTATISTNQFRRFDVGVATRNVPSANTYELEIDYSAAKADKVTVRIVDGANDVEQSIPLTDFDDGAVTLNGGATNAVSSEGALYVRYERTGSGNDPVSVDVDYQRLRVG